MNTPPDPFPAWRHLQAHASAQLPSNFADNVLRASRITEGGVFAGDFLNAFFLSAGTAILCLLLVIFVHSTATRMASREHLRDWEEISMQIASLDGDL